MIKLKELLCLYITSTQETVRGENFVPVHTPLA